MSRRPRLAMFTPLNPLRSGVSDYSEDLVPHLSEHADVDVVIDDYTPSNTKLSRFCNLIPARAFQPDEARYDGIVYQVANNLHQHGYMLPFIATNPGVLVLHDYCLQYLILGVTAFSGNLRALEEILAREHGQRARKIARRLLLSLVDPYEMSFAAPLVEASKGVVVHSRYAQERIRRDFPHKMTSVVPMGVEPETPRPPPPTLRGAYGIDAHDFIVASISTMTYTTRLHLVLDAMKQIALRHDNVKLLIVGSGPLGRKVRAQLKDPILARRLVRTGWVSADDYRDLISIADVVVDLRYPTGAETSASLLRALAAGVPAIVSDHGSFAELPDQCCIKLAVDGNEASRLADVISDLVLNEGKRNALANGARAHVLDHHSLKDAAAGYAEFVDRVAHIRQPPVGLPFGHRNGRLKGRLIAGVYRLFRFFDLYRKYGLTDTLARTRTALRVGREKLA